MKRALVVLLGISLLSGCVIPGMRSDNPGSGPLGWLRPGDAAPDPASSLAVELISLTPDLVSAISRSSARVDIPPGWVGVPSPEYVIGPRDLLSIGLWGRPELNVSMPHLAMTEAAGVLVDDEGYIYFPYAGRFMAAGLTVPRLRDVMVARMGEYFKDPQISLRIADYRSKRIYVDGELRQPGLVPIRDVPMTLAEALNRTGGMLPSADQTRISVLRNGQRQVFNLPMMLQAGISPDKVLLRDGDALRVPSVDETKIAVIGEVTRPLTMPLRNGRLSLGDALAEALGVSSITGNRHQIYVVRSPDPRRAQVFHLDARQVSSLVLANAFPLQPKDVIYVDAPGLVRFNRVLSLILPSVRSARAGLDLSAVYQTTVN